jgi:DNA polymerase-3 subunit epsilon
MISSPSLDFNLDEGDYIVVDTETTGGKAGYHRIIEIGAVHYRDGIIYNRFSTLVNPGRPIPPWITLLTGIDDEMVKNAPPFSEVARPFKDILNRGVFTAHNAPFDYGFVQAEFHRMGEVYESPVVCTLKLARHLFPDIPSRSLGRLCDHLLIDVHDRHRAFGDAEATVYVFKSLLHQLKNQYGIHTWRQMQLYLESSTLMLPQGIDYAAVANLPQSVGAYVFKDANGEPIFQGQSKNIQKRVRNLFARSNKSQRSERLRESVRSIELK